MIIGLSVIILLIGTAPVGLGLAACTQPVVAQLPHAMIAAASLADSFKISIAVLPAIRKTPFLGTVKFDEIFPTIPRKIYLWKCLETYGNRTLWA